MNNPQDSPVHNGHAQHSLHGAQLLEFLKKKVQNSEERGRNGTSWVEAKFRKCTGFLPTKSCRAMGT